MIRSEIIAGIMLGMVWGVILTLVAVSLWFHERNGWVIVLPILFMLAVTASFFMAVEDR